MILKLVTPIESGVSTNGKAWKRCTALFETVEHYPKNVAVTFLGDLADVISRYKPGHLLKVKMDAESHEHQGRYYTELRAWNVRPAYEIPPQDAQTGQPTQAAAPQPAAAAAAPAAAAYPAPSVANRPDFDNPLPPLNQDPNTFTPPY